MGNKPEIGSLHRVGDTSGGRVEHSTGKMEDG